MEQMAGGLRIGAVAYLNTKPLIEGLVQLLPDSNLVLETPSRLACWMKAGKLDVGLIPVAEYIRAKNYSMVPGLGITSFGPVESVLLLTRFGLPQLKILALDEGSRTSSALTKIMLAEKHKIYPEIVNYPMSATTVSSLVDGILLIGDRAMSMRPSDFNIEWDLGDEWTKETGLPFVYAVWAIRPGLQLSNSQIESFHLAYRQGIARLTEIARRESKKHGCSEAFIVENLTKKIGFTVGEKELEGLEVFRQKLEFFERN